MSYSTILKLATSTVGLVQVIKNLVSFSNSKIYVLFTLIIAGGVCALNVYAPEWVSNAVMVFSISTVCYDTVYKGFVNIVKIFSENLSSSESSE